jgi:hypothetical protein
MPRRSRRLIRTTRSASSRSSANRPGSALSSARPALVHCPICLTPIRTINSRFPRRLQVIFAINRIRDSQNVGIGSIKAHNHVKLEGLCQRSRYHHGARKSERVRNGVERLDGCDPLARIGMQGTEHHHLGYRRCPHAEQARQPLPVQLPSSQSIVGGLDPPFRVRRSPTFFSRHRATIPQHVAALRAVGKMLALDSQLHDVQLIRNGDTNCDAAQPGPPSAWRAARGAAPASTPAVLGRLPLPKAGR